MCLPNVCHVCTGTCRGQKRTSEPLELELHGVGSHRIWLLEIEPGSSAKATNALNCLLSQLSRPSPTFQKAFMTKFEPEYLQPTNLKSKSQKCKVFLIPIIPAFPSPPLSHTHTPELKTVCILDKHSIIKPHPQLPHCLKNYCLRISYNET